MGATEDGRPIDPVLFQRDRSICRGQASVYAGREGWWIVTFTDCMLHFGYIPLRRDIHPETDARTRDSRRSGKPGSLSVGNSPVSCAAWRG